jgi:Dyp-type peroxidase family
MTKTLDLADIQGNILQDFGRGFPTARFFFLQFMDASAGRRFVRAYRSKVTTALPWGPSANYPRVLVTKKPVIAVNIAFTWRGLLALELPTRTLRQLPYEFINGMKARAEILGDVKCNEPGGWDPIWNDEVHAMVGLNAPMDPKTGKPVPELERETEVLKGLCMQNKVTIMSGHRPDNALYQDASAITLQAPDTKTFKPLPIEHFGFRDGLGEPFIEGQDVGEDKGKVNAIGGGKILAKDKWAPLATGEFLLGHPDEAQEDADGTVPSEITRNGTFMVYRKLHQNIARFNDFISRSAGTYAGITGTTHDDAVDFIKAKMIGRWKDGVPVAVAPTIVKWREFSAMLKAMPDGPAKQLKYVNFTYSDDPEGIKCPVTSHIRRVYPRDGLNPGVTSTLSNRRRIVRRGLPYGQTVNDDSSEHGIIFMAMCSSLSRQYEFVQQQWLNYGLDANAGNDTCPLLGNREGDAKFVIPVDPKSGEAPFILSNIPQFVETRGGDYFFLPSMTALRMIGMGIVDPT